MTALLIALRWFYNILVALILIRCFGSWFVRNPYGSKWFSIVMQLTEPLLAPWRKLLARFQRGMMIDFSPVIALMFLSLVYKLLIRIIILIAY